MSRKRTAKKLSYSANNLDLGPRVGWWLRSYYQGSRAKEIGREFEVSEGTAKRWLSGDPPTTEHLARMARAFGWRFVNFVMEPAVGTPAMFAEMQAFEDRLARLEAERMAEDAGMAVAAPGARADRGGKGASLGREVETTARRRSSG
jgi:transcriptional regulator with XRE-family HTH domain